MSTKLIPAMGYIRMSSGKQEPSPDRTRTTQSSRRCLSFLSNTTAASLEMS